MSPRKPGNAKTKILEAACNLFYQQGYQATTVDQVIERSGISKPTVYTYFPSKEDLCVAYLQQLRKTEGEMLKEAVRKEKTPRAKFLAIIRHIRSRLIATDFRGCAFFNMISEIHDEQNRIVQEARIYVDTIREIVRDAVMEVKAADGKLKRTSIDRLVDVYYLLIAGAIMASQEYRAVWPADRAVEEAELLLDRL